MAALRQGIRTVIIPKDNERDLEEIDQTVRKALNFVTVQSVDVVLETALNRKATLTPSMLPELSGDSKIKPHKADIRQ